MKRVSYISWDEFFMGVAKLASQRSKDPSHQIGAVIVDPSTNRILSVGYNGLPRGLNDNGLHVDDLTWSHMDIKHKKKFVPKEGLVFDYWEKPQKYDFVVHAEENCFFNTDANLKGSVIYIFSEKGYYPCSSCTKGIIQNGIIEVVLNTATDTNTPIYDWAPTLHMLEQANIKIRILNP